MEDNAAIRRRRYCEKCGERFTTYERIDTIPLAVIKSDNTRETFDRDKILKGVMMSCNKRPISVEQMEQLVSEIENTVMNSMKREIESKEIGRMVMEKLKNLDEIAYVRFASVYRKFQDLDSFMDELANLLKEKKK
jgi:transcriptional repressor NrdR